jgi:hypothetical protein
MESIFDKIWRLGPAGWVLKAILVAVIADALLLAFILLRRTYRKRYFARRDARVFELRKEWNALISGKIPFASWRNKPFDRRIVETIVLDVFEAPGSEESARLLQFLRVSGLIEKRIFAARHFIGWRRMRALVCSGPHASAGRNSCFGRGFARPRSRNKTGRPAWLRADGKPASRRGNPYLARRQRFGGPRASSSERAHTMLCGTPATSVALGTKCEGRSPRSPRPRPRRSGHAIAGHGPPAICGRRP